MAKHTVNVTVTVHMSTAYDVEADSIEEAQAKAIDLATEEVIVDLHGNYIDIVESDVAVDSIE